MIIKPKEKPIELLIVALSVYSVGLFLVAVVNPYLQRINPVFGIRCMNIYYFFSGAVLLLFANPVVWSTKKLSLIRISGSNYSVKRNMVLSFLFCLIAIKFLLNYHINHTIINDSVVMNNRYFLYYFMLLLGGFAEECLFKGLFFRLFEQINLPFMVNITLVSLLFSVVHWTFSFGFIVLFFISFVSLILFRFYPSILVFSAFHILWNISTYL